MIKTSMAWAYALAGMFHGPPAASRHAKRDPHRIFKRAAQTQTSVTGTLPKTVSGDANNDGMPPVWMNNTLSSFPNAPARTMPINPAMIFPV